MVKGQVLRTLKQAHLKNKPIISFDLETTNDNKNFYHAGFYSEQDGYKVFYTKQEAINYIYKKSREIKGLRFVATNLMFDWSGLFYKTKEWNNFKLLIKNGKMLGATHKDKNKNYTVSFIDTLNYFARPLKTCGEIIGMKKLDPPKFFPNKPSNEKEKKELEEYNKRDCEITYYFMKFLEDGFAKVGAKTKLTIASTSLDLFRRKFQKKWIFKEDYILKRKPENTINNFIFESYAGGRTETFTRSRMPENKRLKVYDINSMYADPMLQPLPNPASVKTSTEGSMELLEYEGVSKVIIQTPEDMKYPFLHYRRLNNTGKTDKLIFPRGIFEGTYTHAELRKALSLGYEILKFKQCVYYTKTERFFSNYINTIYEKKKEYASLNDPLVVIYKSLLTNLYGKFGERTVTEEKILDSTKLTQKEFLELKDVKLHPKNMLTQSVTKEVYKNNSIPIFTSYICGLARINLYSYIKRSNALYCDTDSVFTFKELPTSNKIGDMKLEYTCDSAILIKPKMYMLKYKEKGVEKTKVRLKGVPVRDQRVFNKILLGETIHYDKFTKLKESIKRGFIPNQIIKAKKKVSLEDDKRQWSGEFDINKWETSNSLQVK